MTDVMYSGLIRYDETFFTGLTRVLNEETVEPRYLQMMGMLLPLGIEKGFALTRRFENRPAIPSLIRAKVDVHRTVGVLLNKQLSNPISGIWALQLQENTHWLNKPERKVIGHASNGWHRNQSLQNRTVLLSKDKAICTTSIHAILTV